MYLHVGGYVPPTRPDEVHMPQIEYLISMRPSSFLQPMFPRSDNFPNFDQSKRFHIRNALS
jgi:hypothetical protein